MAKKTTICWNCGNQVPIINYKVFKEIPKCSKCGCEYPEKPKIEVELSKYQEEYLNLRKKDNQLAQDKLNQFFHLLHELTFNIICSKLKGSAKMLDKEEIEDMVQWSLLKLLGYYRNKPNFKIKGSFTGYMSQVVLFPLYNNKTKLKNQIEISLDAPISVASDNNQTLLDKLSFRDKDISREDILLDDYQLYLTSKEILSFFKTTSNRVFTNMENQNRKDSFAVTLQLLCYFYHFISQKNDRFFSEVWKTTSLEVQDLYRGSLTILYNTIIGG